MDHDVIGRIASDQHGLVTRRQLIAAGVHPDAVDTLVRRARLVRAARGVYAVPGAPRSRQLELTAHVLRSGTGALAVGEPVLAMLGVSTAELSTPATVLLPPGRRVTVPWRTRTDLWADRTRRVLVDGVPSVSLGRNVVEAAADLPAARVESLVDGVRWLGRQRLATVVEEVAALPDHRGSIALLRSGALGDHAPESPRERVVEQLLSHHGFEPQVWITAALRVDLLLRSARLVLEYDGWATHSRPRSRDERAARDDAIRGAGHVVVHVRSEDLAHRRAFVHRIDALVAVLAPRPTPTPAAPPPP